MGLPAVEDKYPTAIICPQAGPDDNIADELVRGQWVSTSFSKNSKGNLEFKNKKFGTGKAEFVIPRQIDTGLVPVCVLLKSSKKAKVSYEDDWILVDLVVHQIDK